MILLHWLFFKMYKNWNRTRTELITKYSDTWYFCINYFSKNTEIKRTKQELNLIKIKNLTQEKKQQHWIKFRVSSNSFMKHSFYKNVMTDRQNTLISSSIFIHLNSSLTLKSLFIQQMIKKALTMKCINMKQQIQEKLVN